MALVLDVRDAYGERITVVVAEAAVVLRVGKLLRPLKIRQGALVKNVYTLTGLSKVKTFLRGRTSFCLRYSVTKDGAT